MGENCLHISNLGENRQGRKWLGREPLGGGTGKGENSLSFPITVPHNEGVDRIKIPKKGVKFTNIFQLINIKHKMQLI
jgi:hypothetical protein